VLLRSRKCGAQRHTQIKEFEMKTRSYDVANRSSLVIRLDTIRMSELDRRQAYANLHNAELVAGLVLRAVDDLCLIARGVEYVAASLAGSIKAMFAKPVKR
jgi:hypothetical protein